MQEAIGHPTVESEEPDALTAAALRAEAWSGESFLHPGEDAADVLAEGRARRRALDAALAELDAGRRSPSPEWKVDYALMLGLERVLTDKPPRLASGTELRRHQIDALAGMLAELIARHEQEAENGNGPENGKLGEDRVEEDEEELEEEAEGGSENGDEGEEYGLHEDPGAVRRYRFRHPTASGKTIAAAGFVEAARTMGVLILTHRRLLVDQFKRDLTTEGYGERLRPAVLQGQQLLRENPLTIQTYAWFARHVGSLSRTAYQLVICDEAHTALGEKTSSAIRRFTEPIYIGMTATEQLIAKQVSDVFPASVDDLPLGDAARRGLIAPLRSLRVRPAAAISSVPIVGGDYDQEILAKVLDQDIFNQAAASLYRDRFDATPGIVYAAGVDHAYNLAREFRAAGLKAEAVSGRTPPVRLAETLAAYERGDINILINAQLLAEGWNSPRATVCMHLAPTASRRVYQQRIGRIMRLAPRKEAGVVVDFVDDAATHNDRTVTIHSLLDSDFYRPGARVTPAPRRRIQRRAKRKLSPAPWLVPVTPDARRRVTVITREWERVAPGRLADDEQLLWARIAGRQVRFEERQAFAEKLARASRECREAFLLSCAAENPNRRLRLSALGDRVAVAVDRADFDDLVTMVTSAPTWEKDRVQGVRVLLRAIGEGKVEAPQDIVARWTWRLARATRKIQDRRASADLPEAKRLLGALTNSRGHRHEENAARLVNVALEQPTHVAAALLASAEAYTPTAQRLIDGVRERIGTVQEVANALADNLPAPKQPSSKSRRRRRKKKRKTEEGQAQTQGEGGQASPNGKPDDAGAVAPPPQVPETSRNP
jgi:ribonuclease E